MVGSKCFDHSVLDVEARLAQAHRLSKDRAYRDASGLFFIEGVRNFVRLVDNKFELATILFSEKLGVAEYGYDFL